MRKEDRNANDNQAMEATLTMIHSLIASAEVFLKHRSISKYGGFALTINGIKIFKVHLLEYNFINISHDPLLDLSYLCCYRDNRMRFYNFYNLFFER